ncbi:MAG: RNA polymerase sigma factor [Microlunatus sp.]|nr:RNA polymerase sigma factor [Microlunatus sp.]
MITESASGPQDVAAIGINPGEFERFYREHLEVVRVYLARRMDDPFEVADLTADIFLRAIAGCTTYRRELGPPRAWLIGIARNTLGDHRRSGARGASAIRRLSAQRLLDDDSTQRILERICAQSAARLLLAAIAELPDSLRHVVELVAVDDLSLVDAARVLGISAGAARVRYHRARRRLRTTLPRQAQEVTP